LAIVGAKLAGGYYFGKFAAHGAPEESPSVRPTAMTLRVVLGRR